MVSGGGMGGAHAGSGGPAETNPIGTIGGFGGLPFGTLTVGIQGGNGGATAGTGFFGGSGSISGDGGGGGGDILIAYSDTNSVVPSSVGFTGSVNVAGGLTYVDQGGPGEDGQVAELLMSPPQVPVPRRTCAWYAGLNR